MCGIGGIVGAPADGVVADVESMLQAMVHRGPDQGGVWSAPDRRAVLGHRRLSIIDLSEAGRQPMIEPRTGAVMVYNGECYNFLELRAELESLGHSFRSQSDSEVVLAAYSEWSDAAFARLRGMFAIAIWSPHDATLTLVRDRVGIKPLYWVEHRGAVVFASEVRALLTLPGLAPRLDPAGVRSYLWHGFVCGPGTLVAGVHSLEAGTLLKVAADGRVTERRRYAPARGDVARLDTREAEARLATELDATVQAHMVADVPLGIFLSGGVDSSVISAVAQRNSSQPVVTFNIRFEEARYDESAYAREVAGRLGTDHREILLTERMFEEQLEAAIGCVDQPTFDALNTYFVSRAVREAGLTVALAGTGGDELFGGYASFGDLPRVRPLARAVGLLPQRALNAIGRSTARLLMGPGSEVRPQTRWGKFADVLATRGDLVALYQTSYAIFSREMQRTLLLSPADAEPWGLAPQRQAELAERTAGLGVLEAIAELELASFVGERLLRDTDFASMAVSLEVRVPLLDHGFIDAARAVPEAARFQPLRRKDALKRIVAKQLPAELFDRPKAGFELPLGQWCRSRLAGRLEQNFQDINLAHAVGLNAETVGRLWRAFRGGDTSIYWSRIWGLYVLMDWCRRHGVYAA
ncbi:MAG: asparagine synthase (glutamine-hydrolyzing) [Steroidobacteraceae bacterium]